MVLVIKIRGNSLKAMYYEDDNSCHVLITELEIILNIVVCKSHSSLAVARGLLVEG